MAKAKILIADNDPDACIPMSEFLELKGYEVITATNLTQARSVLGQASIDLAILDMRLKDDADDRDSSGLSLAKESKYYPVAKIIMTGYPTYKTAREALSWSSSDGPPAIYFMDKEEGLESLVTAIEKALTRYTNPNLSIAGNYQDWGAYIIGDHSADKSLYEPTPEIEKLLCRVFYDSTAVTLERIATTRPHQVLAWANPENNRISVPRQLLKVLPRQQADNERSLYNTYGKLVEEWSLIPAWKASVNLSAVTYKAKGFDLASAWWLADRFEFLTTEEINQALDKWFYRVSETLYGERCAPETEDSITTIYQKRLGLDEMPENRFRQDYQEAIEHTKSNYPIRLERDIESRSLLLQIAGNDQISCPDAVGYLYTNEETRSPVTQRLCLGNLDGFNILIDKEDRPWLADFSGLGPSPAVSDFVSLEAAIRFQWIRAADLGWGELYEFNKHLSAPLALDDPIDIDKLESKGIKKALAVISHLRQLAARVAGADDREYQIGLLFHIAKLLISREDSLAKSQALLAMLLISRWLEDRTAL